MNSSLPRVQTDWGRSIARGLCFCFGLLGALPLAAGFLIRSDAANRWVSAETARVLKELLQVEASYEVSVSLLPLEISVSSLRVESTDGAGPALLAERATITPRVFGLIAGRLDIGELEIEGARVRLVIEAGVVQNVDIAFDDLDSSGSELDLPFRSLSVTDAQFDVSWDGRRLRTGTIDADVFSQRNGGYEVALRAAETWLDLVDDIFPKPADGSTPPKWDGDVLCQLDARARIDASGILLRRFSAIGGIDIDPAAGTRPDCKVVATGTPLGRFAIKAEQLHVNMPTGASPIGLAGSVMLRLPLDVVNRFSPDRLPFQGWVGLSGDLAWQPGNDLPDFSGQLKTGTLRYGPYIMVEDINGHIDVIGDRVFAPELHIGYGDGEVRALDVQFEPLEEGLPLHARRVHVSGVPFAHLMRDIDVTPNAIVNFMVNDTIVDDLKGTIFPLALFGDLRGHVDDFRVYDRAYHDPAKVRMFGINSRASIQGRVGVRIEGLYFDNHTVRFGNSRLSASCHVGFSNWIELEQPTGTLDLADVSPLVNVPMSGVATIETTMGGPRNDPLLKSKLAIEDLVFAGFEIGDVKASQVRFRPLFVNIEGVAIKKGSSTFELPTLRFDFDTSASVLLDASINSKAIKIRDFLALWGLENDPRWSEITGVANVKGQVRYQLGGERDRCKGGRLTTDGHVQLSELSLFGESYDSGDLELALDWVDFEASHRGINLSVPSFQLRKGSGTLLGSAGITLGAKVRANVLANGIPLSSIDSLGEFGKAISGSASATGSVGGTIDAMTANFDVRLSPIVIGRSRLAASRVAVSLAPRSKSPAPGSAELTACGQPVPPPFELAEFQADAPVGQFALSGSFFGGAIELQEVSVTRARKKVAKGRLRIEGLDLQPFLQMNEAALLAKVQPSGRFSGEIAIRRWALEDWSHSDVSASVDELWFEWKGLRAGMLGAPKLLLQGGSLSTEALGVEVISPDGYSTIFDIAGRIDDVGTRRQLDARWVMRPIELASFDSLLAPGAHLRGTLQGEVHVTGPIGQLKQEGGFFLRNGELALRDSALRLSEANLDIELRAQEIRIVKASATLGGGRVFASGSAPLSGLTLGAFRGKFQMRGADLPVVPGVKMVLDADLEGVWHPASQTQAQLPKISGTVGLRSFEYARPVLMTADISALTGQARKTKFESYDPTNDRVEFDVLVTSSGPLRLNNNLIEAKLKIDEPGLHLTGTNQRYGLRGRVRMDPGGRITLRRNQFEVRSGEVRFDDATDVIPRVDVRAVTEYRRFSNTTSTGAGVSSGAASSGASAAGAAAGQWRIAMHAYGDADELKLDLSSQPELSQDDIFLLLTLGLTRAELDQANLQGSVALEALGSLTGADTAVTDAIPVIDEFRFGSSYSSQSGRSEPTVTIGKRLTERIRAYVTSGLNESREVRSNLEWRLNPRTSIEGSYDNINDTSSSSIGNIGADVRWRLEF